MLNTNNAELRNALLKVEHFPYVGGIIDFKDASYETLKKLVDLKVIDPDGQHEGSPTFEEIISFMSRYAGITAFGHVVSPERHDYGTIITGVRYVGYCSPLLIKEFTRLFHRATNLYAARGVGVYAWYD